MLSSLLPSARLTRSELQSKLKVIVKTDSTARRTRDADGATTADRLMVGAAELFRRKGYAGTTTRELSALLGIQNSSLYYHMEKKEDLLYKLCLATLEDVSRELQFCIAETPDPF